MLLEQQTYNMLQDSGVENSCAPSLIGVNNTEDTEYYLKMKENRMSPKVKLVDVRKRIQECKICGKIVLISNLRSHETRIHNKYKCARCNFEGNSGEEYRVHLSLHDFLNPCRCLYSNCGQSFVNRTTLKFHVMKNHIAQRKEEYVLVPVQFTPSLLIKKLIDLKLENPKTLPKSNLSQKNDSKLKNTNKTEEYISRELITYIDSSNNCIESEIQENKLATQKENKLQKGHLYNSKKISFLQAKSLNTIKKTRKWSKGTKSLFTQARYSECFFCKKMFKRKTSHLVHVMRNHLNPIKPKSPELKIEPVPVEIQNKSKLRSRIPMNYSEIEMKFEDKIFGDWIFEDDTLLKKIDHPNSDIPFKPEFSTVKIDKIIVEDFPSTSCDIVSKPKFLKSPVVRLINIGDQIIKPCLICKEDIQLNDLIQHVKRHIAQSFKNCELCDFKGLNNFCLGEHLNTHFKIKPWKCTNCSKGFVYRNSLRIHVMNVHSTIRLHKCHLCNKSYAEKRRLITHFRNHHTSSKK